MDLKWAQLGRTGKATVTGGALVAAGTALPWMSYSGGSASLLSDGKMEVVISSGMSTDTATVASSGSLWAALLVAAVAVAVPLYRGWDWKSALPAFLLGSGAYFLFALTAIVLHGDNDGPVLVEGEPVAQSASIGVGMYAVLAGTVVIALASLGYLIAAGVAKLRG